MEISADFDIIKFMEEDIQDLVIPGCPFDSNGSDVLSENDIMDILAEEGLEADPPLNGPSESEAHMCPVCGRPAGKYLYYGSQVCVSCRGFFRRSVQNNHQTIYQCIGDLNCVIDSTSRKSCRFCRYQKCLEAGMNPAYVLSPAERKVRILRQYRSKSGSTSILPKLKFQRDLALTFTQEEKIYHHNEFKAMINYSYGKCLDFFVNRLDEYKSYHETFVMGIPMAPEKMKLMTRLDEVTITSYCLELDDCLELSFHDRMTLVKNNFSALYGLVWAAFGQDSSAYEYFSTFLELIKARALIDDRYRPLARLAEELFPAVIETALVSLNEILPADIQKSRLTEFNQETRKVRDWCTPAGSKSGPDRTIVLIFYRILLFGTEFSDRLDDPAKVRAIQDKYLWQLHRYIKTQFSKKGYALLHATAMLPLSIRSISKVLEEAVK